MSVIKRTSYFIAQDKQEFEVPFEPVEDTEKVTITGDKARVSFLSQDEANGWYFDEDDSGRYINFDPRCRGERMDPEQVKELIKANPGRAFRINKYQHSGCVYYRQGSSVEASIPDKRWDVSSGVALFIVPDDAPDPKKYCDAVMKEFTDWCNGEIYGICRVNYIKVDDTWKQVGDDEACWGYIGREYVEQELTSGHKE